MNVVEVDQMLAKCNLTLKGVVDLNGNYEQNEIDQKKKDCD